MPVGDFPPHPLDPDEVLALVRHPNHKCRTGARDRAILAVLWRCGLRNAELRNLNIEHLSVAEKTLRIMMPKGSVRTDPKTGKKRRVKPPRVVGVDDSTMESIRHWLEFRPPGPGPLFVTFSGKRIVGRDLREMIARKAREAGLMRRVHPHCLRHTYARALYDEGVGIVHIQKALGHAKLATTANYLESIGASEVVAITSERTWQL